jgi:hypothetical protein
MLEQHPAAGTSLRGEEGKQEVENAAYKPNTVPLLAAASPRLVQ